MRQLSAADVADQYKTKRYWDLMNRVSEANREGKAATEHQLLRSVQDELHKSFVNQTAEKMIHK